MAKAADIKAPQPLSESFDAEDGWLDKLIADEDEPERATLWRLGSWAIAAVVALTLGLMSGQLPDSAKRSEVAGVELASQAQRIEGLARETRQETRRIAAAVETLNSDRDRLFGRMTAVEQSLDSVTGSIAKQASSPAPAEPAPDKPTERSMAPAPTADAPPSPAPSPAPVAAATPEPPKEAPPKDVAKDVAKDVVKDVPKVASLPAAAPPAVPPSDSTSKPSDGTSKKADRSDSQRLSAPVTSPQTAPPIDVPAVQRAAMQEQDAAATSTVPKPAPGQQVASAPPAIITAAPLTPLPEEALAAAVESDVPVERTQFGLDIGGASSMTGLRALWGGVRKSHPEQFAALRPVLAIRQSKSGLGLQVRVIAGPIPDAAAAAKLCAMLAAESRECEMAIFDGQRLLPETDDAKKKPVTTPKSPRHKQAEHEATPTTQPRQPTGGKSSSLSTLLSVH